MFILLKIILVIVIMRNPISVSLYEVLICIYIHLRGHSVLNLGVLPAFASGFKGTFFLFFFPPRLWNFFFNCFFISRALASRSLVLSSASFLAARCFWPGLLFLIFNSFCCSNSILALCLYRSIIRPWQYGHLSRIRRSSSRIFVLSCINHIIVDRAHCWIAAFGLQNSLQSSSLWAFLGWLFLLQVPSMKFSQTYFSLWRILLLSWWTLFFLSWASRCFNHTKRK